MAKKRVEITVPVYNEEVELKTHILRLYDYCRDNLSSYDWQITIADNASTDNTPLIATTLSKMHSQIRHFRLEQKGRGRAVKRVWTDSDADYCSYMDLDLSTDIKHIPELFKKLEEGYDIVIGSRLTKGSKVEGRTWLRELTSRTMNFFFIRFFFNVHITDAQCGFKAVNRRVVHDLIPRILDNDWFFDGELLIVGEKSGYKIYEIPVHWVDNPGSTVRLLSTIINDLKVMYRLYTTRPWKNVK